MSIKYIIILFLFASIFSCNKKEENPRTFEISSFPQKWKLVETYGGMIPGNQSNTGEKMPWQESYTFYSDSTFLRSRTEKSGTIIEEKGVFELDSSRYRLTYKDSSTLLMKCRNNALEEILFIESPTKIRNSSCVPSDGLGLVYNRIE